VVGTIGFHNPSIEYTGFYVRNTEICWCQFTSTANPISTTIQSDMRFTNRLWVAVEETRQRAIFSFLHTILQQSTATARAHNPQAFGAHRRKLSTPQARFREGYREIPHGSRKTSKMSNATMSEHSNDENDDFSLLTNLIYHRTSAHQHRTSYISIVTSSEFCEDYKRFCRQLRT